MTSRLKKRARGSSPGHEFTDEGGTTAMRITQTYDSEVDVLDEPSEMGGENRGQRAPWQHGGSN